MAVMQGRGWGICEMLSRLAATQSHLGSWLTSSPALDASLKDCRLWRAQLHLVARSARSAGLFGYSSLSLRIGEQLEPWFRLDSLPRWAVEVLCRWAGSSLNYLQFAEERECATELVALLSISPSAGHYGAEEQARLLHELIDDRKELFKGSRC